MASRALVSVEEFLNARYEGIEPEYWDGSVIERGASGKSHSSAVKRFLYLVEANPPSLFAFPDLRLRLGQSRFLVPDVSVFHVEPASDVPEDPPFIVLEVLSPDDRLLDVKRKLEKFVDWGVPHVWLVDPFDRQLFVQDAAGFRRVSAFELTECGVRFTPDAVFGTTRS